MASVLNTKTGKSDRASAERWMVQTRSALDLFVEQYPDLQGGVRLDADHTIVQVAQRRGDGLFVLKINGRAAEIQIAAAVAHAIYTTA